MTATWFSTQEKTELPNFYVKLCERTKGSLANTIISTHWNLYSALIADVVSRWHRILGHETLFSTGTDEHGLKIQQAALNNSVDTMLYCDTISQKFKDLFRAADIKYDHFIRTTDERHIEAVQSFWNTLYKNGYIYKGSYEGWYSMSDESFLSDDQVMDGVDKQGNTCKVSVESGNLVEWMKEDNYLFRLSHFGPLLAKWLDQRVIQPSGFESVVRHRISSLSDLSVSREQKRLAWGIQVPNDHTQTIYVWLDALVNYLTVSGYPGNHQVWPADCHVVGKDILQFHAVYWPAFLMAAGMDPPRKILCHSHWLMENYKMSKSRGNVVDPFDRLERYTTDGLRYFLLREGVPHSDGNYADSKVIEYLNSELCNTLGNLLSRCTAPAVNVEQTVPVYCPEMFGSTSTDDDQQMVSQLTLLPDAVNKHYLDYNIYNGIDQIMAQLRLANKYVEQNKPWELVKHSSRDQKLKNVLFVAMENLRVAGILLQPIVPSLADKLLTRLGVGLDQRSWNHAKKQFWTDGITYKLGGDRSMLFPRIVSKTVASSKGNTRRS